MGRQAGPVNVHCRCVVCVSWHGFAAIKSSLDDAAYAMAKMDDLLGRHFTGPHRAQMRKAGELFMDTLSDAADVSDLLDRRLRLATKGRCLTWGTKTLPHPVTVDPLHRYH
jgi:hypothetical protein